MSGYPNKKEFYLYKTETYAFLNFLGLDMEVVDLLEKTSLIQNLLRLSSIKNSNKELQMLYAIWVFCLMQSSVSQIT